MKLISKNDGLYIYWDLDDVIVSSSDSLQKQVNDKTDFKTDTLKMLEQLKRNCEHLRDMVKIEYMNAAYEGRFPNLHKFSVFNEKEKYSYYEVVKICNDYIELADILLNQFLEERDSFLEKDNLPKGQRKNYSFTKEKENFMYFDTIIRKNIQAFIKISEYCLEEIKKLSDKARLLNTDKPMYGSLIKMDNNDILRDNEKVTDRNYLLYEKPIIDVNHSLKSIYRLYDILNCFKEYMNASHELINYNEVYTLKNVNFDAIKVIKYLDTLPIISGQCILSHHNGTREETAKRKLIKVVLPNIPFIGLRFHENEHTGERRGRSSKFNEASKYSPVEVPRMVLIDDSMANDTEWDKNGGKSILFRKFTDAELMQNKVEDTGLLRITRFDINEIEEILENYYNSTKGKQKYK